MCALVAACSRGIPSKLVTFPSGKLALTGFLYRPTGTGPFPAIVYNHGSEPSPGRKVALAQFFAAHGYVLFVPHRRGQGRSAGQADYIGKAGDDSLADALVAQADDVMAAVAYVAGLPGVDASRIAVVGCSFGGIETLLAAERGTGIVAAVDFAGDAMLWSNNARLQERMRVAARNAKVPVLFLQAANDYDTAPSRELWAEMVRAGKVASIHIYPPNGATPKEGHAFCQGTDHPPWGDEVLAFLAKAMLLAR